MGKNRSGILSGSSICSGLFPRVFERSEFVFQPGVCHSTVLRIVPSEEVSEAFITDAEITVANQIVAFSLVQYMPS